MSYEVHKITSRQDLKDAVNFIHSNNFSLKTFEEKISYNLDDRVLGLLIKDKDKIVGNIFYYYAYLLGMQIISIMKGCFWNIYFLLALN